MGLTDRPNAEKNESDIEHPREQQGASQAPPCGARGVVPRRLHRAPAAPFPDHLAAAPAETLLAPAAHNPTPADTAAPCLNLSL